MSKKKNTEPNDVEARILKRREDIETAVTEIINTVETYFAAAPFEWIEGDCEELGCKAFPDISLGYPTQQEEVDRG